MKDWQTRVIQEKTDLDEKIKKLEAFMETEEFSDEVDEEEQERLTRQGAIMQDLSLVLDERIAAFKEEDDDWEPEDDS